MDKVNEYLKKHYESFMVGKIEIPENTVPIICKDGYSISIQASNYHYCTPRSNRAWPYEEVELGYPTKHDDLIDDFAEEPGTICTVYPYVPIDIANQLIEKHGGIVD